MLHIKSSLVSVTWLSENINAENLIVLDATIPKVNGSILDNSSGYIPKSQFFDLKKKFSNTNAEFPNTIPNKTQFETEARLLGITNKSAIVVYDQHGLYSSARAWWLFKYFGHQNIAVLDGGLPEWIAKNLPTVRDYSYPKLNGNFKTNEQTELIANFEVIQSFSKAPEVQILDARSSKRFNGETPEPRNGLRSGTIPNSLNLPFTELLNGNKLKSEVELKSIFDNLVLQHQKLVFSCGSGITACNLALAASISGYKNLVVYDGSWTEYGTLTKNIMDTPNWTKDELIAYTLLYAAHSDFNENNHERNVIISKVDMQTFQKIHDEFSKDNDYQSIQKILASVEQHNYSKSGIEQMLADIKGLFFSDGNFDIREHSMLLFLKRILK